MQCELAGPRGETVRGVSAEFTHQQRLKRVAQNVVRASEERDALVRANEDVVAASGRRYRVKKLRSMCDDGDDGDFEPYEQPCCGKGACACAAAAGPVGLLGQWACQNRASFRNCESCLRKSSSYQQHSVNVASLFAAASA
jgi:hypothetical protein